MHPGQWMGPAGVVKESKDMRARRPHPRGTGSPGDSREPLLFNNSLPFCNGFC